MYLTNNPSGTYMNLNGPPVWICRSFFCKLHCLNLCPIISLCRNTVCWLCFRWEAAAVQRPTVPPLETQDASRYNTEAQIMWGAKRVSSCVSATGLISITPVNTALKCATLIRAADMRVPIYRFIVPRYFFWEWLHFCILQCQNNLRRAHSF